MTPHVHVGVVEALVAVCYLLIFTFLWRIATARLIDRPVGRAMAAVYS